MSAVSSAPTATPVLVNDASPETENSTADRISSGRSILHHLSHFV